MRIARSVMIAKVSLRLGEESITVVFAVRETSIE